LSRLRLLSARNVANASTEGAASRLPRRSLTLGSESSEVWGLLANELSRLTGRSDAVFSALHRPWRWTAGRPQVAQRDWEKLRANGVALPKVLRSQRSEDGATKLLLGFGLDAVEAVHMPRAVSAGRVTLCLSSQVGCALGCRFCATAQLGLRRQLRAGEIVAQVLVAMRDHGPRHPGELTLVFMGMGEPLHNLGAVLQAISVLSDERGLGLCPRRITVSTSGLLPEIERLAVHEPRPLLAVSLNATTDEQRSSLMPINRRYPLEQLRLTLRRYPLRPRERITIEYVLLRGVNDSLADARRLADFCADFPHHINLIPFNASEGSLFAAPLEPEVNQFARALLDHRPTCVTVRRSRGQDIAAACGQLASAP
jgi:23S rRNA (adenine2503-C2)-methyltransferase